jgi:hypothetical protein
MISQKRQNQKPFGSSFTMSHNLPATPSAFPGFCFLQNRPDYLAAEKSVRRFSKVLPVFFAASVLVFLIIFGSWDHEILRWKNFFSLVWAVVCSGGIYSVIMAVFGHPLKDKRDVIRTDHINQTLALIIQTIRDKTSAQSEWRWLPLSNAGSVLFFTSDLTGIINLDADKILYIYPHTITDCRIESRNVGSTTQTQGSAYTVGTAGNHVLGAYTTGSATSSTEQHYSHVVDLYTKEAGATHLPLYFGRNEEHAKEAYGRVRAMLK